VTSTKEQAQQVAQTLMYEHPPATLVIPIGGDGTLTTMIQYLWDVKKKNMLSNSNTKNRRNYTTSKPMSSK
jgi:diacylglycerol kinase family enzyme